MFLDHCYSIKCHCSEFKGIVRIPKTLGGRKYLLQWATKVVETLLGNDAFRYLSICSILFASSVNSLPGPPIQSCVGVVVCAVEEIKKNQHCFWGKGENVIKMLKNSILLLSVSTLLSPIVAHSSYLL